MNRSFAILVLTFLACAALTGPASALNYCWNLPTGEDWATNAALWYSPTGTTGTIPGTADRAILKTPGVMKMDAANQPWATSAVLRMYVGDGNTETDIYTLPSSEGHVLQTGGTFSFKDYLILSYWAPGTSTYALEGGVLKQTGTGGQLRIGDHGDAAMTVSGAGAAVTAYRTYIGYGLGVPTTGTLTMSDNSTWTQTSSSDCQFEVGYGSSSGVVTGTANATVDLYNTASITARGYSVIGIWNNSHGVVTLHDSSKYTTTNGGDLVVGDANPGTTINPGEGVGVLNIMDTATVTLDDQLRIGSLSMANGTLNIASTTGTATLKVDGWFTVGYAGAVGQANVGDGALINQTAGTLTVGDSRSAGDIAVGTFTMNGGTINRTTTDIMAIGYVGGQGTWNQNGGTLANNTAGVLLGHGSFAYGAGGSGTLNLNGGTFEAAFVRAYSEGNSPLPATINFNGGLLRAKATGNLLGDGDAVRDLQAVVQSGGAAIDSNGFDLGVDAALTDGGGGGGLTKQGLGVLALRRANAYTGATNVAAGGLAVTTTGSVATSDIILADGTSLALGSASAVTVPLANLSLGAGSTVELALTPTGGTAADTITTNTLNLPGATTLRVGAQGTTLDTVTPYTVISQGTLLGAGTINAVSLVRGTAAVATVNPTNVTVVISGNAAAANLEWSGAGAVWDAVGAVNWTNLGSASADQFFELDTVTFNDNGLANPNITVNGRIHPTAIVETGTTSYTLAGSGEITGATTTLSKTGTGTLTLDNSGGLTIGGAVVVGGGTLNMGANSGENTLAGTVSLSGGAKLGVQQYASLTLPNVVSDDGVTGLTKTGLGTLVLANSANTYAGVSNFDSGTVVVSTLADGGAVSSIGTSGAAASNLRLGDAAGACNFYYTGPDVTINRGFGLDGTAMFYTDNDVTMTGGVQSTTGTLVKGGPGTLTLLSSGANTLGTRLDIYGGEVVLDGPVGTTFTATGSGGYVIIGGYTGNTGSLVVQGNAALTAGYRIYLGYAGGNGNLTIKDNAKVISTRYALFGSDGGDATLNMSGNALLQLKDTARVGGQGQGITPGTVDWVLADKARIECTGFFNIGENFYTTTVTMSGESSLSGTANIDFAYGNNSNCTVVMDGLSNITSTALYMGVNGFNATCHMTMNEDTWVKTGRVDIGSNGSDVGNAKGTLIMNDRAKLTSSDAVAVGNNDSADGLLVMTGDSQLTAATWISVGNVYNGQNGHGSGEVFLSDNAQLIANDHVEVAYGGTGTVHIGDGTLTDNAVLRSAATALVLGWGTQGLDTNARIDINGGGTLEATGIITGNDGAGLEPLSSVLNFDGGTLKARAANPDFISNAGGALVFQTKIQDGGAQIDTNTFDVTIKTPLLEDAASIGGGLTKLGEGILTLTEACSYTGNTEVSAGGLAVDGSITSDVTVAAAAALLGNGTVFGDVTAAGEVRPGTSIGTLTVNGDMAVSGTLDIEYDSDTEAIDLLVVSGELDLTGATISFSDLGTGTLDQQFYVFATYETLVGAPAIETGVPTGYSVVYDYNGNSIALVPEPAMLVLLASMVLVIVGWRRQR